MFKGFKIFFEEFEDIFGFRKKPEQLTYKKLDDLPIKNFNTEEVIDRLSKWDLGRKKPTSPFMNICQWGENVGAIRCVISPRLNIKIQRLHQDLEGNDAWIMKKYFFIDDYGYGGKEDIPAFEIYDLIQKTDKEELDAPKKEASLEPLAKELASRMKSLNKGSLAGNVQVKKVSEREYIFSVSVKGGVGAMKANIHNIIEIAVNLSHNKNTGLIRTLINAVANVSSGRHGSQNFMLQIADYDELYCPTQSKEEICQSIVTALKTY